MPGLRMGDINSNNCEVAMTDSQKRLIEEYLNELASDREAGENWNERYMVQQAIYGAMDVLGILGYSVDESSTGHFRVEKA